MISCNKTAFYFKNLLYILNVIIAINMNIVIKQSFEITDIKKGGDIERLISKVNTFDFS